ncbi:MAG: (Fe-S)-binding protein, partial [Oscillospiraceae bacterium]
MEFLTPVLIVTVIGILSGLILALASKFMAVKVDERFDKVRECLPGANCGACGFAGCDALAKAIAAGEA